MSTRIKFDNTHNVILPTFSLANRNGTIIGIIPAYNIRFIETLNSYTGLEFDVDKSDNNNESPLWNQLETFKLIWCREYDVWFEICVVTTEENGITKSITAESLGECELSQINLYNIEINTEDDISRDDYEPTVLFDSKNNNASLLYRIMEKAPHYKISHVDSSIKNIQRTFTFDGISLYDAFQEISKEINCIFIINNGTNSSGKIAREISVYDLESYCLECGHRDEFMERCPECGNDNIIHGYGEDTTIFVSTANLANNISFSIDKGSVKNCFKLEAGDDLMTATIMNCNPNGSGYIWYISDEIKSDMSDELVTKLNEYDDLYAYYQKEYTVNINKEISNSYNGLIDKYYSSNNELEKIPEKIVGYPSLMNAYYNTIDMYLYLNDSMMPNVSTQDITAITEANKLNTSLLSSVAVSDITKASETTVNSTVLSVAKSLINTNYRIRIDNSSYIDNIWTGNFVVTNYSNEEDTTTSAEISIQINDNYETYVKQKLDKVLSSSSGEITNISDLFKLNLDDFRKELKKYCLVRLVSFHDACESCLNILIEQGIANSENWEGKDPNLYAELYIPYYQKLHAIEDETKLRENELIIVAGSFDNNGKIEKEGMQTVIDKEKNIIQDALNFQNYLGDLWLDFAAYRREDTYQNDNYISDGLNNKELFNRALEFIETAKKEIYKSATLQHKISASLKDLLAMKEFAPIVNHFQIGNWIRVCIDNTVYKLRLISYEISYNEIENIEVTFSDVKRFSSDISDVESILSQTESMATSYGSVSRQASQGKKGNQQLQDWVTKGLALTKMKIIDNADNQNITWDSHGLLCKEYLPITDDYDDKQLKIINRGLYLTDDAWKTSKAGIGDFTFYNPETGEMEEAYGVIADTLVGNLILSEKVGIYNMEGSVTIDKNGISVISDNTVENNISSITIQKKTLDENNNEMLIPMFYVDSEGDLVLNGSVKIRSTTNDTISNINDICDDSRLNENINSIVDEKVNPVYTKIDEKYSEVMDEATRQLEEYKVDVGQYMEFGEDGLTLGATSSVFKTVIDNQRLAFKENDLTVAYISNSQLNILNAIIRNSLVLGNFFFSPREDNGVSITWQDTVQEEEEIDGIVIVQQPQDISIIVGETATFEIIAKGKDLTYQWQYRNYTNKSWQTSKDATTSTYSITPIDSSISGERVRCILRDSDGNRLTSNEAILIITDE